jgi:hypothetical protein
LGALGRCFARSWLALNQFNKAYAEDDIIEKLIFLIRELGRFPVTGELRIRARSDENFPGHNVFARIGPNDSLQKNPVVLRETPRLRRRSGTLRLLFQLKSRRLLMLLLIKKP